MPKPIIFQLSDADAEHVRSLLDLPAPAHRDVRPWLMAATLLACLAAAVAWWQAT